MSILNSLKLEKKPENEPETDNINDRQLRNVRKISAYSAIPLALYASGKLVKHAFTKKPVVPIRPKTPIEKIHAGISHVKDSIKDTIIQHPKTSAALGTASAIGAGYGAYKYLKNRKNK